MLIASRELPNLSWSGHGQYIKIIIGVLKNIKRQAELILGSVQAETNGSRFDGYSFEIYWILLSVQSKKILFEKKAGPKNC